MTPSKALQDALNALGVLPPPKPPEAAPAPSYQVWRPSTPEEEPPF